MASKVGWVGKIGKVLFAMDVAQNVMSVGRGVHGIVTQGANVGNVVEAFGGAFGLGGNALGRLGGKADDAADVLGDALHGGQRYIGVGIPQMQHFPADTWAREFGKVGPGYGRLVKDLPKYDPMRIEFEAMVNEMRRAGVPVITERIGGGIVAAVGGESLRTTGGWFRYDPGKFRIVDFLEERIHWQQLQAGMKARGYSADTLEILAKVGVLSAYGDKLGATLKAEMLNSIRRVRAGTYFPEGLQP